MIEIKVTDEAITIAEKLITYREDIENEGMRGFNKAFGGDGKQGLSFETIKEVCAHLKCYIDSVEEVNEVKPWEK